MNREIIFYKDYFLDFYNEQTSSVRRKINYVLDVVRYLPIIPETFFKHIEGTNGLYEIRIAVGTNIFRVFCFFDDGNLIVVANGFQKKTQKSPKGEIDRAERIRKEYYAEKN